MNKAFVTILFSLLMLCCAKNVFSQEMETDTISGKNELPESLMEHSPRKATLYSTALPGLGQAYNKKYWKIPVIYAGFAGCGYLLYTNNKEYRKFVEAYAWLDEGSQGDPPNEYAIRYTTEDQLLSGQYQYRRALEQSVILTLAWYGINIIDASVDAHFFNFDINEDLTLNWQPVVIPTSLGRNTTGIAFTLKF